MQKKTNDILEEISLQLEQERNTLNRIKQSVERCEALPSVATEKLLNLPTILGKTAETPLH